MSEKKKPAKKFLHRHYDMMRVRGISAKHYTLIKETYTSLYLRDKRDGSIKILTKYHL